MIKVAIAGSHGVGKTTLAYSLADHYNSYEVTLNTQIARSLIKRGYPLGKDATAESYVQYIIAQLSAEQGAAHCDLFISDRTLLDPLSYAIVNSNNIDSTVPQSIIEMLKRIWLLELQQYDLYVFVPIEFSMQKDGVRPEGDDYRVSVEEQMLLLLDENHVNYIRVYGSPDERKAQAVNVINKLQIDSTN